MGRRVKIALIIGIGLLGALVAFVIKQPPSPLLSQDGLPANITFRNPRVMPEGIEWHAADGVFLHGSFTQGTIFAVNDAGVSIPFIENAAFVSTAGLHIDQTNNRLLIAHGDMGAFQNRPTAGASLSLYAYDLATRHVLFFADMSDLYPSERHFTNDVTTDADGNAYVTDSFSPVIYRVTPDGEASIWLENDGFGQQGLGLNGIEYHPDGYLIVANMNEGRWFKIPVGSPQAVQEIQLSEPIHTDGLILHPSGMLVSVDEGRVVWLTSTDDWETGVVSAVSVTEGLEGVTTLALRGDVVYAMIAQLRNPIALDYRIVRVESGAE